MGMILAGCGGGGGSESSGSSGTISINITDAKPMLPDGVQEVLITFDEVSVHKSGGGWTSLPLSDTTYEIDLLQFIDGKTTQLVPPVQLESGKYTQVQIGVTRATLVTSSGNYTMIIPSDNLKTDKNFEFTVEGGGAVDLTVDFDLSQSIVVTGNDTYQLKPVLHINSTTEAWTIQGKINTASFGDPAEEAVIVVTWDKDKSGDITSGDEVYTSLTVTKAEGDPLPEFTEFSVFWLVPDESYYVEVYLGDQITENLKYSEFIDKSATQWAPSKIYLLNGGNALF
jgi:hypothetical protein